jgi:hypothetical protein
VTFPVGLLPITSPGHDLGQPDSVALGLVLRSPFVEGLEPVDLGEDIEAPDRFQGSSWIGGMQLVRHRPNLLGNGEQVAVP